MNFRKTDYPYEWLNTNFDIIFISETHLTKGQSFKLLDYKEFHNSYSEYDCTKPRGGLSCFIKNHLLQYVEEVEKVNEGNISIIFKGGNIVFGSYIPPVDSPYFDPVDFSLLANNFTPIGNDHIVIGGDDVNSRVGNKYLNIPFPGSSYKHNVDDVTNSHGSELRKLCRSYDCYVVNNLTVGDKGFSSGYTFYKGDRKSQNDIILSNKSGLQSLEHFTLENIGWNPSDHVPISIVCKLSFKKRSIGKLASADILSDLAVNVYRKPRKIDPRRVNWNSYNEIVETDFNTYAEKIETLSNDPSLHNLDDAVTSISKSL